MMHLKAFDSVANLKRLILRLLYNWMVVSTRLLASFLGIVIFGSYNSSCFSFLVFFFYTSWDV